MSESTGDDFLCKDELLIDGIGAKVLPELDVAKALESSRQTKENT